jgi:hypothetical protein
MTGNERSAQTQQVSAAAANAANSPRRRNAVNHLARIVAGVVLLLAVIAVVFFAGFFTEREYGDLFAAFENSFVPAEDSCIEIFCVPAGRAGQHCRQIVVPC